MFGDKAGFVEGKFPAPGTVLGKVTYSLGCFESGWPTRHFHEWSLTITEIERASDCLLYTSDAADE